MQSHFFLVTFLPVYKEFGQHGARLRDMPFGDMVPEGYPVEGRAGVK